MIENVSFRATTNDLQAKMKKDLQRISNSPDVIVPADKTRNLYITTVDNYKKTVTRHYHQDVSACTGGCVQSNQPGGKGNRGTA